MTDSAQHNAVCFGTTGVRGQRPRPFGSAATAAFSLIEVLIATSILLVIVVLVSMVFQQQSGAFQAGTDRVKGQSAIRNLVAVLSRDLSMAVDAEDYGVSGANNFSGSGISFLANSGDSEVSPLQKISYSFSGGAVKRSVSDGSQGANGWSFTESANGDVVTADSGLSSVSFSAFMANGESVGKGKFPAQVRVKATSKGSGSAAAISGRSLGPDKEADTDDDIFVGGKP